MTRHINMRLTDDEYRLVARECKRIYPYLPVTTALRAMCLAMLSDAKQCLAMLSGAKQCLAPLGVGDARAHSVISEETDKQTVVRKQNSPEGEPEDRIDQAAEVAAAIRECDWHKMRLPNDSTPEAYAEKLVSTYPDVCTADTIREAALWVENNRKKRANKKYLGGFLTNWCRNARKDTGKDTAGAGGARRRNALAATEASRSQTIDWTAGADDYGEHDAPKGEF